MKPAVFFDSDVLIDVFAKRMPFFDPSATLLSLAETGKFLGYTSPIVIANVYYVLQKFGGKLLSKSNVRKIRQILKIVDMNEKTVDMAIESEFLDFEDGLQFSSILQAQLHYIVTRNIKDYKNNQIAVLSPTEALSLFSS